MENIENQEALEPEIIEYNKPPMWTQRVAGGLIDFGLLFLAFFGLYNLLVATPAGNVLTNYRNEMIEVQDEYKLATLISGSDETYGHKAYEGSEEFTQNEGFLHHEDENGVYVVVNNSEISKEIKDAWNKSVKADKRYSTARSNYRFVDFGYTVGCGGVSELVFLLVIPLCNKRRATLGKLLARTTLIDKKYHTPPKWYQMLGRWIWIYLIESTLIYLAIGSWVMLAVPVLSFIITLFNKDRRTLHDFISRCQVIDKSTYKPITEEDE